MAEVVLDHVDKTYPGGVKAVRDFNLNIADGQFIVFVGPSGCGKSTTLRMVAGLEDISGGTIRIGPRVVNDLAPKDRDIAMVFQNYALYPHMTVFDNMAFGLKLRGMPKADIARKVQQVAKTLGIEPLLDRKPKALSGGQRQRVALGRAIVRQPACFLFDEPLSNLDAKLRVEMRAEIKRLHQSLNTTTIYVTHDQEEAMTLGDRIVVMKDGVIQQADTPLAIYQRPANRFVAGFIGTPPMNFLDGVLLRKQDEMWFSDGENELLLPTEMASRLAAHAGHDVSLGLRAEAISDRREGRYDLPGNELKVDLDVIEMLGDKMDLLASTAKQRRIVARVDAHSGLSTGRRTCLHVDSRRLHLFQTGNQGKSLLRD